MLSRKAVLAVFVAVAAATGVTAAVVPNLTPARLLVLFAGYETLAYLAFFATRQWFDTAAGRALMAISSANAILIGLYIASWLLPGGSPWLAAARDTGLTVYVCGVGYLLTVVLRTPRWTTPHPNSRMTRGEDH